MSYIVVKKISINELNALSLTCYQSKLQIYVVGQVLNLVSLPMSNSY
jgi:hypothetical protein